VGNKKTPKRHRDPKKRVGFDYLCARSKKYFDFFISTYFVTEYRIDGMPNESLDQIYGFETANTPNDRCIAFQTYPVVASLGLDENHTCPTACT
jgi:hypothetical protein